MLSLVLALYLSSSSAGALQANGCNDTTRESDIVAGDHNMSEETCQVITFSVAGQSFSTPAKCRTGGAHYAGTVYKCAGKLDGTHCNPRGWQVEVTTWTGGGCPGIPRLDLWSWDGWNSVPEALLKAMECVKPAKKTDKDWSATTRGCAKGTSSASLASGDVYLDASLVPYTAWEGDAAQVVAASSPWSVLLSEYDLAQSTDPTVLPGTLGQVAAAHGTPAGFELDVDVTVEHFDAPGLPAFNVFASRVLGRIASDGDFDVQRVIAIVGEEGPGSLLHRTTFDGQLLRDVLDGAEYGNAYAPTAPGLTSARLSYLTEVEPVFTWAYDPFELPLFEGLAFDETIDDTGTLVTVTRSYDGEEGPWIGEEYVVDVSQLDPHVVSATVYDADGAIWSTREYSNFASYGTGLWRPTTIVDTLHIQGTEDGASVVTTVQINAATPLSSDDAASVPASFSGDQAWQVWQ